MNGDRFFMDTSFVIARVSQKDAFHNSATNLLPRVRVAREIWLHDGILIEVADELSNKNRREIAVGFIDRSYNTANTHVVPLSRDLIVRAVEFYRNRPDKDWGLTDCISFTVMGDHNLTEALTSERREGKKGRMEGWKEAIFQSSILPFLLFTFHVSRFTFHTTHLEEDKSWQKNLDYTI